jgi:flagellar assembly protein FliH
MHKFNFSDVKPFEFSDIKGDHIVVKPKHEEFIFQDIQGKPFNSERPSEETIREERSFEKKNEFKIDNTVRESRGISRQEASDFEKKIQEEVDRRVKTSFQEAYQEGLKKGAAEGRALAAQEVAGSIEREVENLTKVVLDVQSQAQTLALSSKVEIQEFVKRFTKWIILREVDNKLYLEALLEKLVLELNSRRNLIIKVGKDHFEHMPDVLKRVEEKLGQMSNVRIEIIPEISQAGIILESESGLIDGSLEGVFTNIDKIFDQVLNHE